MFFLIQTEYETVEYEPAEGLRVRIRGQTNMINIGLGVCYTQSDREEVDEACKKLHVHRPWSLKVMLTIPISAGKEHSQAQAMQEVSEVPG